MRRYLSAAALLALIGILSSCRAPVPPPPPAPKPHSVTLNWKSTDNFATGYRLYRSTNSLGPFTLVEESLSTVYIDRDVVSGETYYYVVSEVAGEMESARSNMIAATVP